MAGKTKKNNKEIFKNSKTQFHKLYENEQDSDVTLLVGPPGCQERIPGHTWVLAKGSDYFRALFCGPLAQTSTKEYKFPDDDIYGFNNLIRWLYQKKFDFQSMERSLETLQIAIKYLCPDLAMTCVEQITKQLTIKNVLNVIETIHMYSTCGFGGTALPSAPSFEDIDGNKNDPELLSDPENNDNQDSLQDPTACCEQLFNVCLDIVDNNVVEVLNTEHFIGSNEYLVKMILKRPTLKVKSEMDIFNALYRWSTAVCKRQHLPLTQENRRKVLGEMFFQARLLTLTISEIKDTRNDLSLLLNEDEFNYISHCIQNGSTAPPNHSVVPWSLRAHLTLLSSPRKQNLPNEPSKNTTMATKSKRKFSLKKRFNKKEFILDLVTVLALIFD